MYIPLRGEVHSPAECSHGKLPGIHQQLPVKIILSLKSNRLNMRIEHEACSRRKLPKFEESWEQKSGAIVLLCNILFYLFIYFLLEIVVADGGALL